MFDDFPRPLLFAHRGASMRAPENTLAAFELGARLGADVLEMDIHLTADGEVVVHHDADLDRTTNGRGPIRQRTFAELCELDAGYHFEPRPGEFPFRGKGLQIPRLSEVLEAFPRHGFNIEIKQADPPMVKSALDVLERVGPGALLLAAGQPAVMIQLEAAKPGVPLGISTTQGWEILRGVYSFGVPKNYAGRALQIPPRTGVIPLATNFLIQRCQRAGLEVHLWTINDPSTALEYLKRGVDGIMSDDPGELAGIIADFRAASAAR